MAQDSVPYKLSQTGWTLVTPADVTEITFHVKYGKVLVAILANSTLPDGADIDYGAWEAGQAEAARTLSSMNPSITGARVAMRAVGLEAGVTVSTA